MKERRLVDARRQMPSRIRDGLVPAHKQVLARNLLLPPIRKGDEITGSNRNQRPAGMPELGLGIEKMDARLLIKHHARDAFEIDDFLVPFALRGRIEILDRRLLPFAATSLPTPSELAEERTKR